MRLQSGELSVDFLRVGRGAGPQSFTVGLYIMSFTVGLYIIMMVGVCVCVCVCKLCTFTVTQESYRLRLAPEEFSYLNGH